LSLQIGIFEKFKGSSTTTLLFWGDNVGLTDLSAIFRELSKVGRDAAFLLLHKQPWIRTVGGAEVYLRPGAAYPGQIDLDNHVIDWRCSGGQLKDFADMVDLLAAPSVQIGHQYLDVGIGSPIQIIVSKGEYPTDLEPRSTRIGFLAGLITVPDAKAFKALGAEEIASLFNDPE
jgi:hypothetical protein